MLSGIFGAIYKDVDKIHRSYIHTHKHIYRRVYIAYKSESFTFYLNGDPALSTQFKLCTKS